MQFLLKNRLKCRPKLTKIPKISNFKNSFCQKDRNFCLFFKRLSVLECQWRFEKMKANSSKKMPQMWLPIVLTSSIQHHRRSSQQSIGQNHLTTLTRTLWMTWDNLQCHWRPPDDTRHPVVSVRTWVKNTVYTSAVGRNHFYGSYRVQFHLRSW